MKDKTACKGWPEDKYTKTNGKLGDGVMTAGKIKELDKCRLLISIASKKGN